MSHARGQVRFYDGATRYFEFNETEGICNPMFYDTFDEMLDNWRKPYVLAVTNNSIYNKEPWFKKI